MQLIMDPRLPISDIDRQNLWNQRANLANQQRAISPSGQAEEGNPLSSLISKYTQMSGQPLPFDSDNFGKISNTREWQNLDTQGQLKAVQSLFGAPAGESFQSMLLDQAQRAKDRRLAFNDDEAAKRRYGNLGNEIVYGNLKDQTWIETPEGMMERNPMYNQAAAMLDPNLKQYRPLSPSGQRLIAKHYQNMNMGPNPLNPEQQARITFSEANPNATAEQIVLAGRQVVPQYPSPIGPMQGVAPLSNLINPDAQRPGIAARQALSLQGAGRSLPNLYMEGVDTAAGMIDSLAAGALTGANKFSRAMQPVNQFVADFTGDTSGIRNPDGTIAANDPYYRAPVGQPGANPLLPAQPTGPQFREGVYPDWLKSFLNKRF